MREEKKYVDLNSGQLRSLHLIFLQFTSSLRSHAAFSAAIPFLLLSVLFFFRFFCCCNRMLCCVQKKEPNQKHGKQANTIALNTEENNKLHTFRQQEKNTRLHTRSIPSSFINLTSTFAAHLPPIRDRGFVCLILRNYNATPYNEHKHTAEAYTRPDALTTRQKLVRLLRECA